MNNLAQSLRDAADALDADQAPVTPKPPRTLSIMARNVKYGDFVNFPVHGFCEINGWTHHTDSDDVVMSAMGTQGIVHTFPGHKRVQVRRYV